MYGPLSDYCLLEFLFFISFIECIICQALYYTSFDPFNTLRCQEFDSQLTGGGTRNHSVFVIVLRPHFIIP